MKYYIISGHSGDIMRTSNTTESLPSVWETTIGDDKDYWVHNTYNTGIKLPPMEEVFDDE